MNPISALKISVVALALSTGSAVQPAPSMFAPPAPPTARTIRVTEQEVNASNTKVKAAYNALISMWSADFNNIGERFDAPGLARYRSPIRTSCGVMRPNNAGYCAADNTIYFDDVFVTAQAKAASEALGTDGDMAGLGVIAHEMGHAVAIQLGHESRLSYENESVADCLAGAFAKHAQGDGSLEPGDVEEAIFGMESAGDPTPQLTGNDRLDQRILARMEMVGHGTKEQRAQNFRTGFQNGAGACLDDFHGLRA
jgi:predicted metalloprotease